MNVELLSLLDVDGDVTSISVDACFTLTVGSLEEPT